MKNYNEISLDDGKILVKSSRMIVTEYLKNNTKITLDKRFELDYSFNSGVFITLNNSLGLRGCIGYPLPNQKLFTALIEASIAAATEDPRFPPVKIEELDQITFEVTILTQPKEILVSDPIEYPLKIKVGRDGLIVKHGSNSGLLLPQVPVEYSWTEEEFLGHTCEKANLPWDCWKDKKTQIKKFEGIVFKEKYPKGEVFREEI
jgi:uncharacterized protein